MAAWIVLVLLVLAPASLIGGAGVVYWARDREERRRFLRRHRHEAFLLWDTRSGWHDFIVNNVLPSLPAEVQPCPLSRKARTYTSGRHAARAEQARQLWRLVGWRVLRATPSLVVTSDESLRVTSLHTALAQLSSCKKRDARVRSLVEDRLRFTRAKLPGRHARGAGGLLTSAATPGTRG